MQKVENLYRVIDEQTLLTEEGGYITRTSVIFEGTLAQMRYRFPINKPWLNGRFFQKKIGDRWEGCRDPRKS